MARPEELVPGNCYFSVAYHDEELLFPDVTTLRYLRHGDDVWIFENLADQDDADAEPALLSVPDDQLYSILDFPMLIAELQVIAVDHPLNLPVSQELADPPDGTFGDLDAQIARFVQDAECASLATTIRYTDDACSLDRRPEGGFALSIVLRARVEAEREQRVRTLFADLDMRPHTDRLADRGRMRVLAFAIPAGHDPGTLCRRVLTEVYAMRAGDTLVYALVSRAELERSEE